MNAETSQRISSLTPLADVLARVAALARPVAPREVALADAEGRVLAEDVAVAAPSPAARSRLRRMGGARRAVADAGPYAPMLLDPRPRGSMRAPRCRATPTPCCRLTP